VLDLNLILSDLDDFDESIMFIGTSNRPMDTLLGLGTELEAVLLSPNHITDMEYR
jgi:hypothetical protein